MDARFMALGLVASLGGGAFLATTSSGDYYEMNSADVASRLARAQFPGVVNGQFSSDGQFTTRTIRHGSEEVVWEFAVARQKLGTFVAELEPDGTGTRVSVHFEMADSEIGKAAQADFGEGREFLAGVLEAGMEEHVAATLQNRKFNEDQFGKEVIKFALANPGAAKKFMGRMSELQSAGGDSALEGEMKKAIIEDAAWHEEPAMLDTSGEDPTPEGW